MKQSSEVSDDCLEPARVHVGNVHPSNVIKTQARSRLQEALEQQSSISSGKFWASRMKDIDRSYARREATQTAFTGGSLDRSFNRRSPYDKESPSSAKRAFRYSGDLELALPFDRDPCDRPSTSLRELADNAEKILERVEQRVANESLERNRQFVTQGSISHQSDYAERRMCPSLPRESRTSNRRVSWGAAFQRVYHPHESIDMKSKTSSFHPQSFFAAQRRDAVHDYERGFTVPATYVENPVYFYSDHKFWVHTTALLGSILSFSAISHYLRMTYSQLDLLEFTSLQFFSISTCLTWMICFFIVLTSIIQHPRTPGSTGSYLVSMKNYIGVLFDLCVTVVLSLCWAAQDISLGSHWFYCYGVTSSTLPLNTQLGRSHTGDTPDICAMVRLGVCSGVIVTMVLLFILFMKVRDVIRYRLLE